MAKPLLLVLMMLHADSLISERIRYSVFCLFLAFTLQKKSHLTYLYSFIKCEGGGYIEQALISGLCIQFGLVYMLYLFLWKLLKSYIATPLFNSYIKLYRNSSCIPTI